MKNCFNYNFGTKADFTCTLINLWFEQRSFRWWSCVPTTDTDRQVVFGDQVTCSITLKDTSVVAEDAEDMSFKETCSKAQYEEVVKENNT